MQKRAASTASASSSAILRRGAARERLHPFAGRGGWNEELYPESQLPPILRDDPRVGRYWEPGAWRLPDGAAHVYFVGPWRLLTAAMLREAVRAKIETLRCRVMTTWRTVPLQGLRALSGFARKSGLGAVASGASFAGKLVAGAPRGAFRAGRKLAVIRSTLFIRHLDSLPETLVASALADADGRGLDRVTIFFSHVVEPEILSKLLEDRRVASVGTKDAQFESLLPPALLGDARVGRYWEPGNWTLPEPAEHVYFVAPWRLITPEMIGHALRRDVASLRVRVATSWATVPLARIRSGLPFLRFVRRTTGSLRQLARRAFGSPAGLRHDPYWRHSRAGRRPPRALLGRTRLPAHPWNASSSTCCATAPRACSRFPAGSSSYAGISRPAEPSGK